MYDAFGRQDSEAYRGFFAEDVVWHVPGDTPVSGRYAGQAEYFDTMPERMAPLDEWRITPTRVMTNEQDAAALIAFHLTGLRRGRRIEMDGYHMVRLDEAGRGAGGLGLHLRPGRPGRLLLRVGEQDRGSGEQDAGVEDVLRVEDRFDRVQGFHGQGADFADVEVAVVGTDAVVVADRAAGRQDRLASGGLGLVPGARMTVK